MLVCLYWLHEEPWHLLSFSMFGTYLYNFCFILQKPKISCGDIPAYICCIFYSGWKQMSHCLSHTFTKLNNGKHSARQLYSFFCHWKKILILLICLPSTCILVWLSARIPLEIITSTNFNWNNWITEYIQTWKGPMENTESNSWLHTGQPRS